MKLFAKIIDGVPTTTCADEDDTDLIGLITADGFKPYDDSAVRPVVGRLQSAVDANANGFAVTDPLPADVDAATSVPKSGTAGEAALSLFAEPVAVYRDDGDRIVLEWTVVEHSPAKVAAEIARLQSELAATDYRVIKSYEYALAGQDPPYDTPALHAERQAIRDRIRELEVLCGE
jgi:hypothetical protein